MLLVLGGRLLRIFLVKLEDEVARVLEVAGWIPGTIGVVEAGPLDSILDLVPVASGVEDFLYFPLLLFLDDYRRGWRLEVARDRFSAGCGFEEADVEDWVDFDSGREIQLIGACAHFLEDGVWAYLLVVQLVRGPGCSDVLSSEPDLIARFQRRIQMSCFVGLLCLRHLCFLDFRSELFMKFS